MELLHTAAFNDEEQPRSRTNRIRLDEELGNTLTTGFKYACFIETIALVLLVSLTWRTATPTEYILYCVILAISWCVSLFDMQFKMRAMFALLCFYLAGIAVFVQTKGVGDHEALFLICVVLTGVTLGNRAALIMIGLTTLTLVGMQWLIVIEHAVISPLPFSLTLTMIVTKIIGYVAIVFCGNLFMRAVVRAIQNGWQAEERMLSKLEGMSAELQIALEREAELTQSLRQMLAQEQELNAIRKRLIKTVSHEFRTPLTIISTSSVLLEQHSDKMSPTKRAKYYKSIQSSVERLTSMTNDILYAQSRSDDPVEVDQFLTKWQATGK